MMTDASTKTSQDKAIINEHNNTDFVTLCTFILQIISNSTFR